MEKLPYFPPQIRLAAALIRENILTVSHEGFPVDEVDPEIFD